MILRSGKKRKLNSVENDNNCTAENRGINLSSTQQKSMPSTAASVLTTASPTLETSGFTVLKKFRGTIHYLLGYSGPPGSKNITTITQQSRLVRSTAVLDEVCDDVVKYYYERVRGPAGKVKFTAPIQKWRDNLNLEGIASTEWWRQHMVILLVDKLRYPKLESISLDNKNGKLKVEFSIDRRAGQMESRHGLYMAAVVKCGDDSKSETDMTTECQFECIPGTSCDDDDDDDDEEEEEE